MGTIDTEHVWEGRRDRDADWWDTCCLPNGELCTYGATVPEHLSRDYPLGYQPEPAAPPPSPEMVEIDLLEDTDIDPPVDYSTGLCGRYSPGGTCLQQYTSDGQSSDDEKESHELTHKNLLLLHDLVSQPTPDEVEARRRARVLEVLQRDTYVVYVQPDEY